MTIQLIATDLDGTFFGPGHVPSPRNVAAVNAARAAGITVVAVAGRSYFSGAAQAVSTGADLQWFVGSNGGHRFNYATGEVEERLLFSHSEVQSVLDGARTALDNAGFGFEADEKLVWDRRFVELNPITFEGRPRPPFDDNPSTLSGVGKVFVTHPDLASTDLMDRLEPHLDPAHNVTTAGGTFVEVTPEGADKGPALARLCAEIDVDAAQVMAFGDNQNDITMLAWAGRSVAMGNALPTVCEAADEIAPSNTEDGVAHVIEALLADLR